MIFFLRSDRQKQARRWNFPPSTFRRLERRKKFHVTLSSPAKLPTPLATLSLIAPLIPALLSSRLCVDVIEKQFAWISFQSRFPRELLCQHGMAEISR